MHDNKKNVLLIAMPFAGISLPSIQLSILEGYLKEREINIKTKHLYLKAARFYGVINYNFLINRPNESYTAQMIFSKYVFPDHWKKNESMFRQYFENVVLHSTEHHNNFTFEDYVEKTDQFYNWFFEEVDWKSYDIIGFTLNYGQLLPSLAISKKIKEIDSNKIIVFGGSRTVSELGKRVLDTFDYVDYIVSGDGEEPLYLLAFNDSELQSIPNLIYRNDGKIIWNNLESIIDLNSLPNPDFNSFYSDLLTSNDDIKQYFLFYGRLPIEISRGCWWNKCSFCNYNIQNKIYREKNFDMIVEEIEFLSKKYKILDFQMIGNTLPKNHRILLEKITDLNKDYSFFVEARADQLKSDDYQLLKNAGFTAIQTGIESFSNSYLKKINKGVRVIDNIASLKFCKENGISNLYNIIINYPNEDALDFKETEETIQLFKQFLDPPQICKLNVEYGSTIYNNLENFNINNLEPTSIDKVIFPENLLNKGLAFFYNFKRKKDFGNYNWEKLVSDWRNERYQYSSDLTSGKRLVDQLVYFFVDGGGFIKIYDYRNRENIQILTLDEFERSVFLDCTDVTSFSELEQRFSNIPDFQLAAILHNFEKSGIVFKEDNYYLSLPLSYSKVMNINRNKKDELIIYNSGKERSL